MKLSKKKLALVICTTIALGACSPNHTAIDYINSAKKLINNNQTQQALIELKNAVQKDVKNPDARFYLGSIYLTQGDYLSAEKELEKAIQLGATNPFIFSKLVETKVKLGKTEEVFSLAENSKNVANDELIQILTYAGIAALVENKYEKAQQYIDQAISISDDSLYGQMGKAYLDYSSKNFTDALVIVNELLKKSPEFAEGILLKGYLQQASQQFLPAAISFEQYSKLRPKELQVHFLIAQNYLYANQIDKAEPQVDLLLKIVSNQPYANQLKAQIEFQKQHFKEAKQFAEKAFQLNDNLSLSRIIAGISAYKLKNYEQAYQYILVVKDKLPAGHLLRKLLVDLQLKLGYDDEALNGIQSLSNLDENDTSLLTLASKELLESGNKEAAQELLETSINLNTKNPLEIAKQGVMEVQLNNQQKGVEMLEQALRLDPNLTLVEDTLAKVYLSNKQLEQTMEIAKRWQQSKNKKIQGLLLEVSVLQQQKLYLKAKAVLENVVKLDKENQLALYQLGVYEQQAGNNDQAFQFYLKVLKINPVFGRAFKSLLFLTRNNTELTAKAEQFYNDQLKLNPTSNALKLGLVYILVSKQNFDDALAKLESIEQSKNPPNQIALVKGDIYFQQKKWLKALHSYQDAFHKFPTNLQISQKLITCYLYIGDIASGLDTIETSIKRHPDNIGLKLLKANFQSRVNKPISAQLLSSLKNNPLTAKHWLLQNTLGNLAFVNNKFKQAKKYYQQAYKAMVSSENIIQLSRAVARTDGIEEAIHLLSNYLINVKSDDLNVQAMLASTYLVNNNLEKASQLYKNFIVKQPNNVIALNNLAYIENKQNNTDDALGFVKRAMALAPNSPAILETYAQVLLSMKQYDNALEQLNKALAYDANNVDIITSKARVLTKIGKQHEANLLLKAIKKSSPE